MEKSESETAEVLNNFFSDIKKCEFFFSWNHEKIAKEIRGLHEKKTKKTIDQSAFYRH